MRAGVDQLIARVVEVFGSAQTHHGYLFANARGTRVKLVLHDGFGVWCATRRFNQGRFVWPNTTSCGVPAPVPRQPQDQPRLGAQGELCGVLGLPLSEGRATLP